MSHFIKQTTILDGEIKVAVVNYPRLLSFRSLNGGSADVSEGVVRDFLQQETGHLTPPHLTYFSHWLLLCCLEAATMEAKNGRKRTWLQTPEERCEDDHRNLSPLKKQFYYCYYELD